MAVPPRKIKFEPRMIDSSEELKKLSLEIDFEALPVGKSYLIPIGVINESYLRNKVSKASKELDRCFKCVKHAGLNLYEVGRLPDEDRQQVLVPVMRTSIYNSDPEEILS